MRGERAQQPPGLETAMANQPDHGEDSYRGNGRMAGKTAVITGADSGIGKAVAIAYAREGGRRAGLVPRRARGREGDGPPRRGGRPARGPRHRRPAAARALPRGRGPGRRRVRTYRCTGEQRRVPDVPRDPRGDQRRGVGLDLRPQHRRDVPALPGRLAPVYVLLASDEAGYMSAARIEVTGGRPIL